MLCLPMLPPVAAFVLAAEAADLDDMALGVYLPLDLLCWAKTFLNSLAFRLPCFLLSFSLRFALLLPFSCKADYLPFIFAWAGSRLETS